MNPFQITSKAGVGALLVTVLVLILPMLGIEAKEDGIMEVVDAIGTVAGFVLLVWGQVDRKDLNMGLFRK